MSILRLLLLVGVIAPAILPAARAQTPRQWAAARNWLVESELATAGIKQPTVLAAMREVPRHEFVPPELRQYAYLDTTLPIGEGQTISPPYIVAWMTEQLAPQPTDRVLEIGTGSGYQAAVLSRLAQEVYTIEINKALASRANKALRAVGYDNVHRRHGDGFRGWPEAAPFDKIMVTCSPEKVPAPLADQLREGGRMLIPIGESFQQTLCVLVKQDGKLQVERRTPTYFVPMTGVADSLRDEETGLPTTELVNGDFEQTIDAGVPAGWFYLRQARLREGDATGDGGHCLHFANQVPGQRSQALQSIGVDGRQVSQLAVHASIAAKNVRPAEPNNPEDGAKLSLTFFDANRQTVGEQTIGLYRGSFDWRRESGLVRVPPTAIGVTVAVGLFGSTGELSCDNIDVRPLPHGATARR